MIHHSRRFSTGLLLLILWLGLGLMTSSDVSAREPSEAKGQPLAGSISGIAFRDVDNNGTRGLHESGVRGVIVTAVDELGNSATTTTAADGTYTVGPLPGNQARIEFTLTLALDSYLDPAAAGGTTVQFVDISGGNVNNVEVGFYNPRDYYGSRPRISVSIFRPRDNTGSSLPTVEDYDYVASGLSGDVVRNVDAVANDTGTVYGVAFQRQTDNLYVGSYIRRGASLGSTDDTGAIYRIRDRDDTQVSLLVNLNGTNGINTGANPHPKGSTDWTVDPLSYAAVGKIGLGDVEVSDDGQTLYTVNLNERTVVVVPFLADMETADTAAISQVAIPSQASCTGGDVVRPHGLKFQDGLLYVGAVCTAEATDSIANLRAYVLIFNPTTLTFNPTPIIEFPLAYPRQFVNAGVFGPDGDGEWLPWNDTWLPARRYVLPSDSAYWAYPQPILAGIEFDSRGYMMLGFRDRLADQAFAQADPGPVAGPLYNTRQGGDLLLACQDVGGTWMLENAGSCAARTTADPNSDPGESNDNSGPGGREFYYQEQFSLDFSLDYHRETSLGALALLPGQNELVAAVYDTFDIFEAGTAVMNNSTGARVRAVQVYGPFTPDAFAKSGGLGDVELLGERAAIEIGNRLWDDPDRNGIQDPDESPLAGVTVELYDGAAFVATTTTDINGQYLFNASNVAGGLLPNHPYEIRVPLAQAALGGRYPTTPNVASGPNSDLRDSDAVVSGTNAVVSLTTGLIGENNHTFDLGFSSSQLIGDFVWHDLDADGIQDAGEPGIPGVRVNLYDGGGAFVGTTTTNGSGLYQFLVATGNYFVEFLPPPGYIFSPANVGANDAVDSDPNRTTGQTATFTVFPGVDDLTWDAGLFRPGAIGNYVWIDENSDGYQDAGEPGLPNITVQLTWFGPDGVPGGGDDVISTTVTDAHGGYLFDDLPPGNYEVTVVTATLPPGMTQTTTSVLPGGDFGNQIAPYAVTLGEGVENLTADFGYNWNPTGSVNPPTPGTIPDPTAALGDTIWIDADGDGRQDPEEIGVPGITVTLIGPGPDGLFGTADDVPLATTTTNATGQYIFDGLTPGAYQVQVTPGPTLAGYTQTGDPDHFGISAGVNDNLTTVPVVLAPGDVFLNADFGYQPPAGATGSIGDTVWFDADGDGTLDAGEYGIPNVSVVLIRDLDGDGTWDPGEPIIATDLTDANGQYGFAGLPLDDGGGDGDADYLVWVNDTNNVLDTLTQTFDADGIVTPDISAATINAGTPNITDQDFGYTPLGHGPNLGLIGDTIYLDLDGDGTQDAGEPGIEGVTITLTDGTNTYTAVTDENGHYYFPNLPAGTYTVTVTPPAGYVNTGDPDSPGAPDNTSVVTIGVGGINLDQDFGYIGNNGGGPTNGSIGNLIWLDTNANGLFDGVNGPDGIAGNDDDEPPIGGVTVDLYQDLNGDEVLNPGEPLIASTVTANALNPGLYGVNGNYLFTNLAVDIGGSGSADYIVNVTDANGVLAGYWHSLGAPRGDNNSQTDPYGVELTLATPQNLTADFGYYVEPGALGNFVWYDEDGDGLQDAGELGISGVTIQLQITYPNGTVTTLFTQTNSDGYYSFGNLLLDENHNGTGGGEPTFVISVVIPTGYTPTLLNQGGNDQVDSDNPAGVVATATEGLNTIPTVAPSNAATEPLIASYDFGFASALDYGDLPDAYAMTQLIDDGARHTVGSLFLGISVDPDGDGAPSLVTDGDDTGDGNDDEDGIQRIPGWMVGTNGGYISVTVTGGAGFLSGWVDWNQDNDFSDPGERILVDRAVTTGEQQVVFDIPAGVTFTGVYNLRFRLYDASTGGSATPTGFSGGVGEVEDYQFPGPPLLAVLSSFDALAQEDHVLVAWSTSTEINNLGFNLYRSTSAEGPGTLVNGALIPSASPGSTQGSEYDWVDSDVEEGTTYYYWLEDVDVNGRITRHGPVSVTYHSTTAVTLGTLNATAPSTVPLLPVLALLAGVALLALRRRHS